MPDHKEITDLERAYFEIEKIRARINALSDFLVSRIKENHFEKPKTTGMIDPHTGKPFRAKK